MKNTFALCGSSMAADGGTVCAVHWPISFPRRRICHRSVTAEVKNKVSCCQERDNYI